jgi:hypothetical protein
LSPSRATFAPQKVSPGGNAPCGKEQYHVSNFDPRRLLDVLQEICDTDTQLKERGELQ